MEISGVTRLGTRCACKAAEGKVVVPGSSSKVDRVESRGEPSGCKNVVGVVGKESCEGSSGVRCKVQAVSSRGSVEDGTVSMTGPEGSLASGLKTTGTGPKASTSEVARGKELGIGSSVCTIVK